MSDSPSKPQNDAVVAFDGSPTVSMFHRLGRLASPSRVRSSTTAKMSAEIPVAESISGADISLENLRKSFSGRAVLHDISLDVPAGSFFALLGPSGSGKSTMLNLIAGFEQPDAGEIKVRGRSVVGVPAHTRNIGIVFQNYALFPHLNVRDNLAYPLRRRGMDGRSINRKVDSILQLMRLEGLAQSSIQRISGGQQQRVAMARALIAEPEVLLMDEPMAALDKALRDDLQIEIKSLQRILGTTVVYITHDQREAMAMADKIGVLNRGRFEQVGSPKAIYRNPESSFVAKFLAGASVIPGIARLANDEWYLEIEGGYQLPGHWTNALPAASEPTAELTINPVDVKLLSPGEAATTRVFPAIVLSVLYGGDTTLVQLLVNRNVTIAARVSGPVDRHVGESVRVGWSAKDATLFPRKISN